VVIDLDSLTPRVARPHAPDNVTTVDDATGVPVQMVFIGTCTGGRVQDVHEALDAFERAGGKVASGVQLVLTPASMEIERQLIADGSLQRLEEAGAIITTPGCGACCGTSGVIPGDGVNVLSTANIYLASPAVCGVAAATGRIPKSGDVVGLVRAAP
jgi:3-isopropylmalate/(R)-2-methylmalate dehydratase large subunit